MIKTFALGGIRTNIPNIKVRHTDHSATPPR